MTAFALSGAAQAGQGQTAAANNPAAATEYPVRSRESWLGLRHVVIRTSGLGRGPRLFLLHRRGGLEMPLAAFVLSENDWGDVIPAPIEAHIARDPVVLIDRWSSSHESGIGSAPPS